MVTVPNIEDADRIADYTATASQTDFVIPWPIIAESEDAAVADIVCTVNGAEIDPTTTDFTGNAITGLSGVWNGGTLKIPARTAGQRVIIYSDRTPRRTGNFLEGKSLPMTTLDALQDDIIVQIRDLQLHSKRSLQFGVDELMNGEVSELLATKAQIEAAAALVATSGIISGTLGSITTTAALLSLFGAATVVPNGTVFITAGRTSVTDNGGGKFRYDSSDTTTADNGVTIRVDGQNRRWKAVLPGYIMDKMAGVVGDASTDDTTAIQKLFAAGETERVPVVFTKGECKLTAAISWDIYKTHPIGNGVVLNFSSITNSVTTPYCVTITTTHTDPNTMAQIHKARPVEGIVFYFPTYTTGVKGIKLTPNVITGVSWINGLVFQNGGYVGGLNQIEFGAGAFDITHINWGFSSTSGITGSHGIVTTDNGSTNSGEANKLINCFSANLAFPLYDAGANVNADFYILGGSFDNCTTSIYSAGAHFYCYGVHFERWDTYIANVDAATGLIVIDGGEIINTSMNTLVTCPFRSTSAIGGVEVRGVRFGLAGAYSLDTICEGTGRFVIDRAKLGFNVGLVPFGAASNQIPNGAFAAAISGAWTLTATSPTWDGTTGKAANGSMKFDNTAVAAPEAYIDIPCKPGAVVAAQAWIKTAGIVATGHTWSMAIRYCDAKGNTISVAATQASAADVAAFTKFFIESSNTPAPAGTCFARLDFSVVNGAANCQMWVDDVYFQVF